MLFERRRLRADIARRLRQCIADRLLAARLARARLREVVAQRGGHRRERVAPCREALFVARRKFRLQPRVRRAHRVQQRRRMLPERGGGRLQRARVVAGHRLAGLRLLRQRVPPRVRHSLFGRFEARRDAVQQVGRALREGVGELAERGAQVLCRRIVRALLVRERAVPDAGHVVGGRLEAARQAVQLPVDGLRDGVAQHGHFAREPRHRRGHHRLQRGAGHAGALGGAVLQRLPDRRREPPVCLLGPVEKGLLARGLLLVQRDAALFERRHHRLQPIDQRRHHVGLPLQQPERLVAAVRMRMHAQRRRDLRVELLRRIDALAAQQRGQQPEHRGRRHPGDRRAEREAEALDRRDQRRANRVEVGRAFQRGAGALERHHHPEQRAEHPQQHEQADQVRRERRPRQRRAGAFDARAHRAAQARVQRVEPRVERRRRLGQAGHRARKGRGGLPVAQQFEPAGEIAGGDQQRDGGRHRVRRDITGADPAHRDQTGHEYNEINTNSGHNVLFSWREGLRAALPPFETELRARRAARSAYPCGTRPAMRRA